MRYIIAGFIAVFGISLVSTAHAQPEPIKTAREAVIESIEKLDALKRDETIDPIERMKRETELKREALTNIIELSTLETENIREKLEDIEVTLAFEDFRIELVQATNGYVKYFDAAQNLLKGTESLDGIQTIAGQLKDWRILTYDPGIAKAVDLVLVFQNREALDIADQRFEKLSIELRRRAVRIRQSWQPLLLRASGDLDEAHRLNEAAIELLNEYLPKDEAAATEENTLAEVESEVVSDHTVRKFVEGSITKVKEAYGKFISLSDFLKR
ncbi:MAG: hypothetical protein AAB518_01295 [Patescibacteria group bacterium]